MVSSFLSLVGSSRIRKTIRRKRKHNQRANDTKEHATRVFQKIYEKNTKLCIQYISSILYCNNVNYGGGYNQTSKGFIKFSKEIGESEELNFIKTNIPLGSLQAKDFIRELLVKETENRLGQRKLLDFNEFDGEPEAQVHLEATIIGILNAKP
ncbi:hypothetical protein YC2023_091487 [Brassica napus]